MLRLDDLLGPEEPNATFHDAEFIDLHINYDDRSAAITALLFVGNTDAATEEERERTRIGRLLLTDLIFWAQDPPDAPRAEWRRPWLTSDGPLNESPTDAGKRLAAIVPVGAIAWWLYFADTNSFAYCAAQRATFNWGPAS
jgi:hypothetical protein